MHGICIKKQPIVRVNSFNRFTYLLAALHIKEFVKVWLLFLTFCNICHPLDGRRDQQASVWSQQGYHGVQWGRGGGRSQTVKRGAGHHDPPPRGGGETDRSLHLPGNTFMCALSPYILVDFLLSETRHVKCITEDSRMYRERIFDFFLYINFSILRSLYG